MNFGRRLLDKSKDKDKEKEKEKEREKEKEKEKEKDKDKEKEKAKKDKEKDRKEKEKESKEREKKILHRILRIPTGPVSHDMDLSSIDWKRREGYRRSSSFSDPVAPFKAYDAKKALPDNSNNNSNNNNNGKNGVVVKRPPLAYKSSHSLLDLTKGGKDVRTAKQKQKVKSSHPYILFTRSHSLIQYYYSFLFFLLHFLLLLTMCIILATHFLLLRKKRF